MVIALSLVVALIGALTFIYSARPTWRELGRIAFACGVLAFLLVGAEKMMILLSAK
jgi:hypothetical protein